MNLEMYSNSRHETEYKMLNDDTVARKARGSLYIKQHAVA